uniref:Uncharacterized protein n=1 Tax=Anguilla anguilla TaxID=7936 RepID=A0A0E9XPV6_ANGAN
MLNQNPRKCRKFDFVHRFKHKVPEFYLCRCAQMLYGLTPEFTYSFQYQLHIFLYLICYIIWYKIIQLSQTKSCKTCQTINKLIC